MYSFVCPPPHLLVLPIPFGIVPFRPVRPYCLRSKSLPASRRGPNAYCSDQPSAPTTEQPDLHLALHWHLLGFLSSASWGPPRSCHSSSCLHVHGVKWAQDTELLVVLLQPLSQSLTHSLLTEAERQRERDQA